jgi:hypothetical protein
MPLQVAKTRLLAPLQVKKLLKAWEAQTARLIELNVPE